MASKLDLVLINPGSRTQVYQSLGGRAGGRREPRLGRPDGHVLPAQGLSVEIIDAEAEELIADEVAERVAATSTRSWPRWSSTAISRPPRRRS